jgi:cytoskeletal protein CcmA (bactofilin family)
MTNNHGLSMSELTIIASDVTLTGVLEVSHELHLHGKVSGELQGRPGSTILVKEGAHVEGRIFSDTLVIEGFVRGEIEAMQKVWITARGRVLGSIKTPSLQVDPGAIFEAEVKM